MNWDEMTVKERMELILLAKMDKWSQIVTSKKKWDELTPGERNTLERVYNTKGTTEKTA